MSTATLCLPLYGYCIRGMNESAVVRWGPEGKRGTNGALMKISSLLINVGIYTHHTHRQGRETRLSTCTHVREKQMGLSHHLLIMLSFYLLSLPSLNAVFHSNNKEKKSSSVSLHKYSDKLHRFSLMSSLSPPR